jgi:hypothetical protein
MRSGGVNQEQNWGGTQSRKQNPNSQWYKTSNPLFFTHLEGGGLILWERGSTLTKPWSYIFNEPEPLLQRQFKPQFRFLFQFPKETILRFGFLNLCSRYLKTQPTSWTFTWQITWTCHHWFVHSHKWVLGNSFFLWRTSNSGYNIKIRTSLIQVSVADINGVRNLLLGLVLQENKFQFRFWKSDLVLIWFQNISNG